MTMNLFPSRIPIQPTPADGVKTKLSLLLPTLPVVRRGYERVVENGVVSSINETKGWMQSNL